MARRSRGERWMRECAEAGRPGVPPRAPPPPGVRGAAEAGLCAPRGGFAGGRPGVECPSRAEAGLCRDATGDPNPAAGTDTGGIMLPAEARAPPGKCADIAAAASAEVTAAAAAATASVLELPSRV